MANNKIRETLTDEVLEEILCRFYETSCHSDSLRSMMSMIDSVYEVETHEDKARFLEAIEGMDMSMITPWNHVLSHYLRVKEYGLQTADQTGAYVCTVCKKRVFKRAGQKITPCECFTFGRWQLFWDWEADQAEAKNKREKGGVITCHATQ